jgi:hypothetical protein
MLILFLMLILQWQWATNQLTGFTHSHFVSHAHFAMAMGKYNSWKAAG